MGCTSAKAKKNNTANVLQKDVEANNCDVRSEDFATNNISDPQQINAIHLNGNKTYNLDINKFQNLKQQHNLQYYFNNKLVVPIHQYSKSNDLGYKKYYYSSHAQIQDGWQYELVAFYVPSKDFAESVPVYQYYDKENQQYNYDVKKAQQENQQNQEKSNQDQEIFRVFNNQHNGSLPVFRYTYTWNYQNEQKQQVVYQVQCLQFESPSLEAAGWVRSEVAFYAFNSTQQTVPVYEFTTQLEDGSQYTYYTIDKEFGNQSGYQWKLEKIAFQVPSEDFRDSVPVVKYHQEMDIQSGGIYFKYSTQFLAEQKWTYSGEAFRAFDKVTLGTVPVFLFTATGENDQRTYLSIEQQAKTGFKNETIAFYAFANKSTIPIYQYYAKDDIGNYYYYYSANPNETQDWIYDDIAFYVPTQQYKQAVPVRQFYFERSNQNGGWYFDYGTSDQGREGWKLEKVSFYALAQQEEKAVPVYKFTQQTENGQVRYYLSYNKEQDKSWTNEGIAFWAYQE